MAAEAPPYTLTQWFQITPLTDLYPEAVKMLLGTPYDPAKYTAEWQAMSPDVKEVVQALVISQADWILAKQRADLTIEEIQDHKQAAKDALAQHFIRIGASPDAVGVIFPSHQDVPLERVQEAIDHHDRVEAAEKAGEVVGALGGGGGGQALLLALFLAFFLR